MTNILYGVHGIGHGHTIRALTIARAFPNHNFLFISDADGYKLLHPEFLVHRLPVNGSPAFSHRMPYSTAVTSYLRNVFSGSEAHKQVLQAIDVFKPDLAITDYEANLPGICRKLGIPCLSLDHQHIARFGDYSLPLSQQFDLTLLRLAIWMQFRQLQEHMVISFYTPPLKAANKVKVFPPILRQEVLDRVATDGNHVLAYHGYSTTSAFHSFLSSLSQPVRCYGTNRDEVMGNVQYRKNSTVRFLDDLASCQYVISTAGHTLLSEALYFGKPVMAFPIQNASEQFLNAYYLEENGYGLMNSAFHPSADILGRFLANREEYAKSIAKQSFYGNEQVMKVLADYFEARVYPL